MTSGGHMQVAIMSFNLTNTTRNLTRKTPLFRSIIQTHVRLQIKLKKAYSATQAQAILLSVENSNEQQNRQLKLKQTLKINFCHEYCYNFFLYLKNDSPQ